MVSSISKTYDLTIANASSAPYTLKVMTIVALIFTPLVLVYQGWSYWVFRARLTRPGTARSRGTRRWSTRFTPKEGRVGGPEAGAALEETPSPKAARLD